MPETLAELSDVASSGARVGFRFAMRQLAAGVCVVTVGSDHDIDGLTITSVSSLSIDPPSLLVCIDRSAPIRAKLERLGRFSVNILGAHHREIADRFAGRCAVPGADLFEDGAWVLRGDAPPLLADALAVLDCDVDEMLDRYTHSLVIGRVDAIRGVGGSGVLLNWRGGYETLGWTDDEVSCAIGLSPEAWPVRRSSLRAEAKPPACALRNRSQT